MTVRKEITKSIEVLATDFSPLPKIPQRYFTDKITEKEALKLFIALASPQCPALVDFAHFGFTLETFRSFLSLYHGRTLAIPRMRTWARIWVELQLFLAAESAREKASSDMDLETLYRQIAARYKLSPRYVKAVHERLLKGYAVVARSRL
jgi:hypothetical protein